jgi:type III secretory pathway lipoprotein EscJ
MAGEKQQQANDEVAMLRQQLVSVQREARDAVTRMVGSDSRAMRFCVRCRGWKGCLL